MACRYFPAEEGLNVAGSPDTQVFSVAWQPGQGQRLACATSRRAKIINMKESGTEVLLLGTDTTKVTCVAWSPAGDLLVTLGEENVIWKSDGTKQATLPGRSGGDEASFNTTGRLVAITHVKGPQKEVHCDVFDTITGDLQDSFWNDIESVFSFVKIVWINDTHFFYCGGDDFIDLWRVGQEDPVDVTVDVIETSVKTMAFNAEKGILAIGGSTTALYGIHNGTILLWNSGITTVLYRSTLTRRSDTVDVIWKPDNSGILASCGFDGQVTIWDALAKTILHQYEGFFFTTSTARDWMNQVSFSPDWSFLAGVAPMAGRGGVPRRKLKVVRVDTGEKVAECEESGGYRAAVGWSKEGNHLAVKTRTGFLDRPDDHSVRVYNLEKITVKMSLKVLSAVRVAKLLEINLSPGNLQKNEARMFLKGKEVPDKLISEVCSYISF